MDDETIILFIIGGILLYGIYLGRVGYVPPPGVIEGTHWEA